MKKTYIAPEMEIKKFTVEEIMVSAVTVDPVYGADDVAGTTGGKAVDSISYSELFNIQ